MSAISRDHGAEIYLDKQARKWANELIAEEQQVTDKSKAVRGLRSVSVAYTKVMVGGCMYACVCVCVHVCVNGTYIHDGQNWYTEVLFCAVHVYIRCMQNPEFGTPEAATEAAVKIEELQDEIRHAEVARTVIEAKMDLMKQGGGERADTLPAAVVARMWCGEVLSSRVCEHVYSRCHTCDSNVWCCVCVTVMCGSAMHNVGPSPPLVVDVEKWISKAREGNKPKQVLDVRKSC